MHNGAKHSSRCKKSALLFAKFEDRGLRNSLDQSKGFSLRKKTSSALFSPGFVQIGRFDPAQSWFEVENLKNGQKLIRKKVCANGSSWGVSSTPGARVRADPLNIFYATFGISSFLPGRKSAYPMQPHFFDFRVDFSLFLVRSTLLGAKKWCFFAKSKDRGLRNCFDQIKGFSQRKKTYLALFSSSFV